MRVGVIGPLGSDLFADNVLDALREMGHDPVALGSATPAGGTRAGTLIHDLVSKVTSIQERMQGRVLPSSSVEDLDLTISLEGTLLPATITALKKVSRRVVLWFPDHVANLGRMLMFAADYDGLFFKEPTLVKRARDVLDAPVHYLPEACNPKWHTPPREPAKRDPALVAAGSLHTWRIVLLERLVAAGIPLRLYGSGFPRWLSSPVLAPLHTGRYIARGEKALEFRSASAVLNSLHPTEIEGMNCRLFEATACGATVITEYRSELERFFTPGEELLTYRSFDELVVTARGVLEGSLGGIEMGDAASKRAHKEHSYEVRLSQMFDVLGC